MVSISQGDKLSLGCHGDVVGAAGFRFPGYFNSHKFPSVRRGCRMALNGIDWKMFPQIAPVAQLDRASGYEPEGRRFESCRAHHKIKRRNHLRRSVTGITQRLDLLVSAQKFGVLLRMIRRANSSIVRLAGFYRGTHADRSSGKLRKERSRQH